MNRFHVLVVFLSVLHQSTSLYSIDDGILFKLNFQPTDTPESPASGDATATPSDESLLGTNPSSEFETILMTTRHNEQYHCTLPKSDTRLDKNKEVYTGPHALKILEKLFVAQTCAYRIEHYWTYELCHGKYLRQFHEERDGKKIKVTEYFLGRYTKEQYDNEDADLKISVEQGTVRKPPKKKIETMNLPYYELQMTGGTLCDLTGLPRTTRVQYVCYPRGNHEIYTFREASTCEYEVIILSNIICTHPDYRPEESTEQVISCLPANDKTAKKPLDVIKMDTDALKFRSNKMYEAQMFHGDKGPGSVKIEIKPVDPQASVSDMASDFDDSIKNREENWNAKLRREPFKPLMDPEVVKEFLLGEYCLHGGTGWWKYEFCYGKSVDQYHEEKAGHRQTMINLGRFNREKHLEWIEKNPTKKPKPKEFRKFVSHFYSDGDLCDVTGKPRHIEVKLKCKPSESPSAVSLYLLEPKTCEYILGIESPLVCDILPFADDKHGLMEVTPGTFEHHNHETDTSAEHSTKAPEEESGGFVAPPNIVRFTPEDAVSSPQGDPKNIPVTDDDVIIITDYGEHQEPEGHEAMDYEDEPEDELNSKIP